METRLSSKMRDMILLESHLIIIYSFCRYSAWFVRVTTEVLGVTTEVRNSKTLAEDRGAMICLNHQSALDVIGELVVYLKLLIGN